MTKRAFCILFIFFAVSLGLRAQGYFCDRQGAQLEYVRKEVKDGSIVWRIKGTVIEVSDKGDYEDCTTECFFTKENGKPYYKSSVLQTVRIDKKSNEVSVDVAGAMASYIQARAGLKADCGKVFSALPADAQPGDVLPSVFAQAKVGPLTYDLKITDRKILRHETLVVPAGTFECVVLEEHKVESGPGHNRDVINHTWYSKGVGYVRHDTYIKGKLDTSEILTSITK